ncbi:hypothetical protein G9A89_022949 [Geosiphon pyriformis]|nr:hypothetical protein G9A89_022949 [Geosiphon pyriformis]
MELLNSDLNEVIMIDDEKEEEEEENEFEVEKILNKRLHKGQTEYLLKWKGYDDKDNTWEPAINLNCHDLIQKYENSLTSKRQVSIKNGRKRIATKTISEKKPANIIHFEKLLESDKDPGRLTVVNELDNDGPPEDFTYLQEYLYSPDVPRPDSGFLIGCGCSSEGCKKNSSRRKNGNGNTLCTCLTNNDEDGNEFYDEKGRVKIPRGQMIFECNSACKCGPECPNRVAQKGRTVDLEIFKTPDKGWGVRAMQYIYANTFVSVYCGELITAAEASRRGDKYDRIGRTYLFDLDFADEHTNQDTDFFTVDGYNYGNVSHFFNHSCDPNMWVYPVVIDNPNILQHHLAFFTRRPVRKYEELTFDYLGCKDEDSEEMMDEKYKQQLKDCKCHAINCRGKVRI